jgi:hypothetical protein
MSTHKIKVEPEVMGDIMDVFRQNGMTGLTDARTAEAGYDNIVIGVAQPGMFAVNLILYIDPEDA